METLFLCSALMIICAAAMIPDRNLEPLIDFEIVAASPEEIWQAFTTNEGQESWQVAHADIDLRVGGLMRTHYAEDGRIGDENTIQNLILAFEPERMLTIRIVHPPAKFPFKETAEAIQTVITFEPVSPAGAHPEAGDAIQTRVTVTMMGWPDTDESRRMRQFFATGNRWVLEKLKAHFVSVAGNNTDRF